MNDIREMLKHVYQLDDEARADFQHHQAQRAKVTKQRRHDELNYKIPDEPAQPEPPQLVYKTHTSPAPDHPRMTPEQQAPWDQWADARIHSTVQKGLEQLADVIGGECGLMEKRLVSEIEKLRTELGKVRADFEIMRAANVTAIGNKRVA